MKAAIRDYLAEIGKRGGQAGHGKAKVRATARKAALIRWERERQKAQAGKAS